MRKMISFMLGVLVGTIVATAWAQFPNSPTAASASPRNQAAAVDPHEMMASGVRPLPVEHYQAF